MKKCPYCAREIEDGAIKCSYCLRELKKKKGCLSCLVGCFIALAVAAVLIALFLFLGFLLLKFLAIKLLYRIEHLPYNYFSRALDYLPHGLSEFLRNLLNKLMEPFGSGQTTL